MSLRFHKDMFTDVFNEDGLLVAAKGLGVASVMLKFVKLYAGGKDLVFILSAFTTHEVMCSELLADGLHPDHLPVVVNSETTANERKRLYAKGGCIRATSRILIVDILSQRLPATSIAGFLVGKGHRVSPTSQEAFILHMFRSKNKHGFIKGFSEEPSSLASGFGRLHKVLRALHVRRVHLWPRFHVSVSSSLRQSSPDVVEVNQPLSPLMSAVQEAVLAAMDTCLEELQANTSLAGTDLKMEASITQQFDERIRRQLDPVWNHLKPMTKQVVADLKTLRLLLDYLLRYDCVTLADFLNSIRFANQVQRSPSMWLLSDASQQLFSACLRRLYRVKTVKSVDKVPVGCVHHPDVNDSRRVAYLELVLEPNPKWSLLSSILKEISDLVGPGGAKAPERAAPGVVDLSGDPVSSETSTTTTTGLQHLLLPQRGGACVLVVVQDERTCNQLKTWLSCGSRHMLETLFDRHLAREHASTQKLREAWQEQQKRGGDAIRVSNVQHLLWKLADARNISTSAATHSLKRKREISELTSHEDDGHDGSKYRRAKKPPASRADSELLRDLASSSRPAVEATTYSSEFHFELSPRLQVVVYSSTAMQRRHSILSDLRPNFVVMYDANPGFIRELEVYKASVGPTIPLRVYFCVYDNSVEEQRYLTALRSEKKAFERLIFEKAHLTVPTSPSRGDVVSTASKVAPSWGMTITDSRIGTKVMDLIEASEDFGTVVVDMREFRSRLPCLLYQAGFTIVPRTLEVGDYVLSKAMCFERKSIPDLYGSFASGRLFHQVEVMTRCYERPILLIEFDESKSFSLTNSRDMPREILPHHIVSKVVLLTLHFPSLRIIWSRSPSDTVSIIKALKYKQPEPDPDHAAAIGREGDDLSSAILTTKATSSARADKNDTALDMLLRLPGINRGNMYSVLGACRTLADVCELEQARMVELLGPVNAAKLFSFLHERAPNKRGSA